MSSASYTSASFQMPNALADRVHGKLTPVEYLSASGNTLSNGELSRHTYASQDMFDLAPNIVHDPSTYLIWFDLEVW